MNHRWIAPMRERRLPGSANPKFMEHNVKFGRVAANCKQPFGKSCDNPHVVKAIRHELQAEPGSAESFIVALSRNSRPPPAH